MIKPDSFREAIRSATVTYPVPFLAGILLLFSILCFLVVTIVPGTFAWVIAGCGACCVLCSVAIIGFAVIQKPELLRSEQHVLMARYLDELGDDELDRDTHAWLRNAMLPGQADPASRKRASDGRRVRQQDETESKNG